jgi:hypothetical protein
MAASGQPNPAIAQALFVTVKTVEMHLTSSYRKLNITSRSNLAAALETEPGNEAASGQRSPERPEPRTAAVPQRQLSWTTTALPTA